MNRYTLVRAAVRTATACALAGSLTFAMAQQVRTDYDQEVDFHKYHTFSIFRIHASDGIVQNRMRRNIEQSLQARGYQEVPRDGEFVVTAIGAVRNRQEYITFYNGFGPGWGWGRWGGWGGPATTTVHNIPIGTTAIDLYDGHSHQLIFRGTAADSLSNNPDKNAMKSERAVNKIFDRIPGVKKMK